jgi:uncharacterized protein (TIGR02266 family)
VVPEHESRAHPRTPLEALVQIKLADLNEFLQEYSANVSEDGMFVKTEKPFFNGAVFAFRFAVADNVTVISGTAEVVWSRTKADAPDLPPGMGIRFVEMDEVSRQIIRRIVDIYVAKSGNQPFTLREC